MNPDSENFDSLRRLLALKRHEQPPPGYFNRFSREVIARIKAGESGGEMSWQMPLWERLLGFFDVKPVFAGAFGMAVCALLISGVIASENSSGIASDNSKPANPSVAVNSDNSTPSRSLVALTQQADPSSDFSSSTNPVVPPSSLFDKFGLSGGPVPVNYSVPAGN